MQKRIKLAFMRRLSHHLHEMYTSHRAYYSATTLGGGRRALCLLRSLPAPHFFWDASASLPLHIPSKFEGFRVPLCRWDQNKGSPSLQHTHIDTGPPAMTSTMPAHGT